ncbi:hypothetical protein HYQ46_013189 [Verticillium longisporum]|nr:hypothetical protein HYQ46_013189 [Verticillium longisporum]
MEALIPRHKKLHVSVEHQVLLLETSGTVGRAVPFSRLEALSLFVLSHQSFFLLTQRQLLSRGGGGGGGA